MNLELDDVALFLRIRALGTLSAAARERNWPVSQVSRALARLEAACGARLLHRSTHGLSLTDEGDTFAQYAQRLLDQTLKAELEDYMARHARNPNSLPPASTSLRGYHAGPDARGETMPERLRALPPGQNAAAEVVAVADTCALTVTVTSSVAVQPPVFVTVTV